MIVKMFMPKFAPLVESGAKKQTVRPTPKRMPKIGNEISLRQWTGKPYRSKQRELYRSTITGVHQVQIDPDGIIVDTHTEPRNAFAKADGFADFAEMMDWFIANHGPLPFIGTLYKWE